MLELMQAWLTDGSGASRTRQGLEMKVYLLITIMGLLLTAIRFSSAPKNRPGALPH